MFNLRLLIPDVMYRYCLNTSIPIKNIVTAPDLNFFQSPPERNLASLATDGNINVASAYDIP